MSEQMPTQSGAPTVERNASFSETRHRFFWVGMIFALLGGQILLMLFMTYMATADASFAIEPDYYQKGIHWDDEATQQRVNSELAWSLDFELGNEASVFGERSLTCSLQDRDGQPLDGAAIDAVAFAHARGNQRTAVVLAPVGDGRYETKLPVKRNGIWEFRFVVRRGPDTFTTTQRLKVEPPGGA